MRYIVLLLICLAAIIAYVQRTALTVPTKTIQADLDISERGMGLIMACWFWGYAVLQIPAGLIVDRIGSKRGLLLFVVAWSALGLLLLNVSCPSAAGPLRPLVLLDGGNEGLAEKAQAKLRELGYADVAILEGGCEAWRASGGELFSGVNVPSKAFGEFVEHRFETPRIPPAELKRLKDSGRKLVILDSRPWEEYHRMNIPGGICCPNAELPYRLPSLVKNPRTRIVVNCAGRTRSIIGAQTLINFGVPNPVAALENGTQGWVLADFELERGASRKYPDAIDPAALPGRFA